MTQEEINRKREKEKDTVAFMIEVYCHGKHHTKGRQLCQECTELLEYASARVEHCPHMETKTFCSNCTTHCYKPMMREKIRQIMRYSGPRMIIHCPRMVIRHAIKRRANKKKGKYA